MKKRCGYYYYFHCLNIVTFYFLFFILLFFFFFWFFKCSLALFIFREKKIKKKNSVIDTFLVQLSIFAKEDTQIVEFSYFSKMLHNGFGCGKEECELDFFIDTQIKFSQKQDKTFEKSRPLFVQHYLAHTNISFPLLKKLARKSFI